MRRQDGQARALFRLLTMPILAALKGADVVQADDQEGGEEEAQFCKDLLFAAPSSGGMTHTVMRFMQQMLLALFNGFTAWEFVYWVPETGPNKGKITLRKIDWRPSETLTFLLDGQGEFNGFRQRTFFQGRTIDVKIAKETSLYYACFAGNTRVELLDGTSCRMDEVARRVSAGEELWTYSIADGRIVPGQVTRAGLTGHRKLVAVRLDNDEVIRCTPDHLIMLRDGTYREAGALRPGDSLMPLYRRERPVGSSKQDYEQVQQPDGSWEFTHRVVSNYFNGPCKPGWVTHHKNLNHRDNFPGNLQRLTRGDHERVHALLKSGASAALLDLWSDPAWRARQVELIRQSQRRPETRTRLEEVWASEEWRASCRDRERPHARRDVLFEVIDAEYRSFPRTCREVAESLGTDMATVRRRVRAAGYRSWREYVTVMRESGFAFRRKQWDGLPAQSSAVMHRLWEDEDYRADRSVQSSRQLKALWDDPDRRERQREALRRGWEKRRARNHKVVSVEPAGDGPVYDLTVDGHHNFALTAGVFAHNCNEAERPFYGVSMFESAFFHYDKKCVSGSMKISLLDGNEVEIRELAERSARGEDIWVYGHRDGRIVPAQVRSVWKTGRKKTVRVVLDNDQVVRCTPDHRFLLRDGTYREAQQLKPDDSLMPLYRRDELIGKTAYEQVRHPEGWWEWTHRMVSREQGFAAGRGRVIHHEDLNPRNNRPDNLSRMTRQEHIELHGRLMAARWQDPGFRERRSAHHRAKPGTVTLEAITEVIRSGESKLDVVAEKLGASVPTVRTRVRDAGHGSWREFVRAVGETPFRITGRPITRDIADLEAAYGRISGGGRNVGVAELAGEMSTSMAQIYLILRRAGYESYVAWKMDRAGKRNHKVVAVLDGPEDDVYDMEVPGTDNFALSAGVFVHNCKLYYISHLAAQRAAVGTRVGTMKPNPNAADKNNFVKALANLGLAQYIVLPDADWTVTSLEEKGNFDFLGLINHHNSQMSKSVLAQWFDDAQGAGNSDSALVDFGKQDDATFMMLLDGLLEEMSEVIDHHIFPRFINWNFGTEKYPHFKWGELTAEQKAAIQDTFDKLAVAGQTANVTPEFMLELEKEMAQELGFDIDYDKIEKEREQQQKLMAQQAKAQAQMAQQGQPVQAGSIGAQQGPAGAPRPGPAGGPSPSGPPQSSSGATGRAGPGGPYG